MKINIFGGASQKIIKTILITEELKNLHQYSSLMTFLHSEGITVASSCSGAGVCRKCIVNESELSCQISFHDFINYKNHDIIIEISYL